MPHLHGFSTTIDWPMVWLVTAALIAGAINAVAGGGSFLSFPAFLSMGIPPVQANATNTVAIWPGQLTSIAGYLQDVRAHRRAAWLMGIAGLLGGTTGATVLLNTPQRTFMRMVPWLLLCAALLFAASGPVSRSLERLKRRRREEAHAGNIHTPRRVPLFFSALMVSFYVGYFGAGAGFLFMTMLALLGYEDIHTINALKIVANTLANGIAFIIFIADRQVVWHYGLPAMVACATGGYFSARYARRIPQRVLRTGVVVLGLAMSAWFFWHQ